MSEGPSEPEVRTDLFLFYRAITGPYYRFEEPVKGSCNLLYFKRYLQSHLQAE